MENHSNSHSLKESDSSRVLGPFSDDLDEEPVVEDYADKH